MIRFFLPLFLAACAVTPPVTRIVSIMPEIPHELLICQAAPVVPEATNQAVVADYIVALWQAGQDCRAHLHAIQRIAGK